MAAIFKYKNFQVKHVSSKHEHPIYNKKYNKEQNVALKYFYCVDKEVNEVASSQLGEVLKELCELKEMVQQVNTKQVTIEKGLNRLTKQMVQKDFDLAKSSHAVNYLDVFFHTNTLITFTGSPKYAFFGVLSVLVEEFWTIKSFLLTTFHS